MDHSYPINTIRPSSPALEAQLQALDLLAARLQTLTDSTRWPARVPLNSKATFEGQIVHTNDVKINIGGGYWVAMTATEAADWVRRRKQELLLEHVRRIEGSFSTSLTPSSQIHTVNSPSGPSNVLPAPPVHLNPIFNYAVAGLSKPRAQTLPVQPPPGQTNGRLDPVNHSKQAREGDEDNTDRPARTEPEQTLTDVIGEFVNAQRLEAASSKSAAGGSVTTNEEGLPIHEIREDIHGNTLGAPPPPITNGTLSTIEAPTSVDDYWSEAAKARRAALRRKVFNESSDSDSDSEPAASMSKGGTLPALQVPPALAPVPSPSSEQPNAGPSSPRQTLSPSSTTPAPPKSILKTQARKKSVTFDESVPLPPDSPRTTITAGAVGFPMPVHDVSDGREYGEFEPSPVPTLNQPSAPKRKENGFAGFKPGFLGSSKPSPSSRSSSSTSAAVKDDSSKPKTSIFAQRRAAKAEEGPVPNIPSASSSKGSTLPKLSASQQMASMKNVVVEKAPVVPSPLASSSSRTRHAEVSQRETDISSHSLDEVEDEVDDDDEDDEYDLDDALLAREVALDYHRRQRPPRHRSESDEEYENPSLDPEEEGEGGVMLALPSVSNGKIVKPTPDELRKYVRVGRLENGNLVLAPGEKGWSDDEDGEARANREDIRRQLLGQPEASVSAASRSPAPPSPKPRVKESGQRPSDPGLPPTVRAVTENKAAPQAGDAERKEVPQKMSRFKAARLGLDG